MKALLLVNLGTPDTCSVEDVHGYLKEFLMDELVIDIPWVFRYALVNFAILPRRKFESAKLYQKIWTERGSPLKFYMEDLAQKVQRLSADPVFMAMRYGSPSIAKVLATIQQQGVNRLDIVLMFPQYSLAATESAAREIQKALISLKYRPILRVKSDFYEDPRWIDLSAEKILAEMTRFHPDKLILSFHGLPERHLRKTEIIKGSCCSPGYVCCDSWNPSKSRCYRAQSIVTYRKIVEKLGMRAPPASIAFQSRLGRTKWIEPYFDLEVERMAHEGVRRLLVACPSFTTDCLETLEEVAQRARESFIKAGGEDLRLVPCLNADTEFAQLIVDWQATPACWSPA